MFRSHQRPAGTGSAGWRRRTALIGRLRRDERGVAMATVLLSMLVLTTIVAGATTYALQTQTGSRHDQDYNAALAAARAGVDDLLARLNKDDTYWQHYPGYSPSSANWDCTNLAWKRAWPTSPTPCSWSAGTATGWVAVPNSTVAYYHYDLALTDTATAGSVIVTSSGKVGKVVRTVQSTLRHGGFGEFLYLTNYETVDPSNEAIYGKNNTQAQTKCSRRYWDSPARDTSYCYDINFVSGDTINGPLHTNDAMLMLGTPHFAGTVTTSYPNCNGVTSPSQYYRCYRANGSPNPQLDKGIAYRSVVQIPSSVGSLRQYVDPAQTADPGCLYTGPTRIKFNSDGTMTVWSKWSTSLNSGCGNPSASWPQTVSVPNNKLIYVRDVPAGQPGAVTTPCSTGAVGDGLPVANDVNNTLSEANCNLGTVYLQGTLQGKVTVSAENNIIVTDDLRYAGGTTGIDTIGLIANNSVKIYHPVKCTQTNGSGICTDGVDLNTQSGATFTDPVIQAAILTLQHSFTVQAYNLGDSLGTINLFGSFAQLYRGPVGTTAPSGYLKNYVYDTRLKYAAPPYFLDPVQSTWGSKTFGEVKAAY